MSQTLMPITKYSLNTQNKSTRDHFDDAIIEEQPLQIIIHWYDDLKWNQRDLSITMRTPGDDESLVIGFLLSQQIIATMDDVESLSLDEENVAEVKLSPSVDFDWQKITRTFVSHSGCGICGQSQLKSLALKYSAFTLPDTPYLPVQQILDFPSLLTKQQGIFNLTGGCHGAGLWHDNYFTVKEDVGRHNAVDKIIGDALISQKIITQGQQILVLSGRISFELVQKAVAGNVSVIVAVGAPSDLAVATAKQFNMTLIGFVKPGSFNVYCGEQRIVSSTIDENLLSKEIANEL